MIAESFKNQLLIAMPNMVDPNFSRSVTYICRHDSEGAMGVMINKPLQLSFGELLKHVDIEPSSKEIANRTVLMGGPIGNEQGFILHAEISPSNPSESEIVMSSSKDTLNDIANGRGPEPNLICLGYSGWKAGQLEKELRENSWLLAPPSIGILFDLPLDKRWHAAAESVGVDMNLISRDTGHA